MPKNGSIAASTWNAVRAINSAAAAVSNSGWNARGISCLNTFVIVAHTAGPTFVSPITPASSTRLPTNSALNGTCPWRRASSRRRGDGSSVFDS